MTRLCARPRTLVATLLLTALGHSSFCGGADEAAASRRDIHFVLEDEPYVAEMDGDSEDLYYAAVVRGFASLLLSAANQGTIVAPLDTSGLRSIAFMDSSPSGKRLRELTKDPSTRHQLRSKLLDDYDPRLTPPDGQHVLCSGHLSHVVTMLETEMRRFNNTGGNVGQSWNHFVQARDAANPPLQEYAFLAPSVEEAKQNAADFLNVYDQGFVPWLRRLIEQQKAALTKSRDGARAELTERDKKIAAASGGLEGLEAFDPHAVSDLKVKRTLLKVELAGVKARLSAMEEKLKDNELGSSTRAKLVDLKVSADIDLASLAAQQKVLDELIDGQQRLAEVARLRLGRRQSADRIQSAEAGLPRCDEILADLKPFRLVDDTVVIRPLRLHKK